MGVPPVGGERIESRDLVPVDIFSHGSHYPLECDAKESGNAQMQRGLGRDAVAPLGHAGQYLFLIERLEVAVS